MPFIENSGASLSIELRGDLGVIGHFKAQNATDAIALLNEAKEKLYSLGANKIIGPMNGNTWQSYRFALNCKNPFFLGEPKNPASYPNYFLAAGFKVAERYESRIVHNLLSRQNSYHRLKKRIARLGITTEPLNLENFDQQLEEIYHLSLPAFAENRYYEEISFAEFSALYQKAKPLLDPRFIQLAYDKTHQLIGFAFAYRDKETLIFKTLAVAKEARKSGLGVYLYDQMHFIATQEGIKTAIHALMHEEHNSLKLSKSMESQLYREYALFENLN